MSKAHECVPVRVSPQTIHKRDMNTAQGKKHPAGGGTSQHHGVRWTEEDEKVTGQAGIAALSASACPGSLPQQCIQATKG